MDILASKRADIHCAAVDLALFRKPKVQTEFLFASSAMPAASCCTSRAVQDKFVANLGCLSHRQRLATVRMPT
jgi:hypothetical protein